MTVTPGGVDPLIHNVDDGGTPETAADVEDTAPTFLLASTMSGLRNRTLAPPPPRHPAVRPPSPNPHPRSNGLNVPPSPVYPSHPSLPPRPPSGPRPDVTTDYPSHEPIPSQVEALSDAPGIPDIQRESPPVSPNRPGNPRSFSENLVASTSSVDVKPVGSPIPPLKYPSTSPELLPPVSRTSSFNSIASSLAIPPPVHHAMTTPSLSSDSAYEATLSEKELRDLYDDEEIDRFLRLFSAVGCSSLCCKSINSPPL